MWDYNFLPGVSVGIGLTKGEEEKAGWQPIYAISFQQSFGVLHAWSQ